ncbi:MAG: XrtA/PEP-CTERM system amidotransferase [Kordiimonas sp.]
MCGIAGIMMAHGGVLEQSALQRMTNVIAHRGPDGEDFYFGQSVGLGHRRLSIIDIEGGVQPMHSADRKVILTYNGEVYNFQNLRRELEALGHQFITNSDTEVVLHSYLEWGKECVSRLRGMFAFAIWDIRSNELFLARDRLGIKPLYYSVLEDGSFIFGSELKSILSHPKSRRKLRVDALEDYLTLGYVPDPKSIVEGVHTLEPATVLVKAAHSDSYKLHRYWSPDIETRTTNLTQESELLERLEEAVKLRMIADVPLGAFLSGGMDSSTVVGLMSRNSEGPVETCAIGSEDPDFDESGYAQLVSDHFKTHHRLRLVSANDSLGLIDEIASVFDEPFADLSAMPTYRVCGLAREKVKVALSGDGGDELFAGYRRHRFHMLEERFRSMLPLMVRKPIFGPLSTIYPKLDWAPQFLRGKSTFEALARSSAEAYCQSVSKTPDRERYRLHTKKMKAVLGGYHPHERFNKLADEVKGADPLSTVQYIDLKTYLPGDILTKVDRASMAHSLEVRVPILDHKFVEYSLRLPSERRIVEGNGKAVFKDSLRGFLPGATLDREKRGFIVPAVNWLRDELADVVSDLENSETLMDTGLLARGAVRELAREHISGLRDHHTTLWSLIMLDRSLKNLNLEL